MTGAVVVDATVVVAVAAVLVAVAVVATVAVALRHGHDREARRKPGVERLPPPSLGRRQRALNPGVARRGRCALGLEHAREDGDVAGSRAEGEDGEDGDDHGGLQDGQAVVHAFGAPGWPRLVGALGLPAAAARREV